MPAVPNLLDSRTYTQPGTTLARTYQENRAKAVHAIAQVDPGTAQVVAAASDPGNLNAAKDIVVGATLGQVLNPHDLGLIQRYTSPAVAEKILNQAGCQTVATVLAFEGGAQNTLVWVQAQAGRAWAVVGDRVIEAGKETAAAFAKELDQFTGPIKQLWELIDRFRALFAQAGDLVSEVFHDPGRVADNLLRGLNKGLGDFFDRNKLFDRLKMALFQWLFGADLEKKSEILFNKLKTIDFFDPKQLFSFVIDLLGILLGLTLENLIGIFKEVINEKFHIDVDAIQKSIQPGQGLWDNVLSVLKEVIKQQFGVDVDKIQQGIQKFQEIWALFHDQKGDLNVEKGVWALYDMAKSSFKPDELFATLKSEAISWLVKTVVTGVATWLGELAIPGAAVLEVIYKGVTWLVDNGQKVLKFVQKFLDSIKTFVEGNETAVAGKVVDILTESLPLAFSAIAAALGLGDVVKWIQGVSMNLQETVRGWIKAALVYLVDKIREQLQKLFGKKEEEKKGCETGIPETPGEATPAGQCLRAGTAAWGGGGDPAPVEDARNGARVEEPTEAERGGRPRPADLMIDPPDWRRCAWCWTGARRGGRRRSFCVPWAGWRRTPSWRAGWCGWICRRWGRWGGRGWLGLPRARRWSRGRGGW